MRNMKDRKTSGQNNLSTEIIKCLHTRMLTALFNKLYETGEIPQDWLLIPKKPHANDRSLRILTRDFNI